MPAKLIAYLFAARPIIALALPGSDVARIVAEAGCGWILEPDCPEALGRLLDEVAAMDRAELLRRGRAGREFALKHLTRQACLPRLADIVKAAACQA
jgi:hypothetical protein